MLLDLVVVVLMVCGLLLFLATTVGLLRFPDFYTRVHAAGKGDTLSTVLMLGGLIIYLLRDFNGETALTAVKLSLIVFFVFIASPTATHAIIDAGYESKVPYWTRRKGAGAGYDGPERRRQDRQI
ncbi:MAG TPA: sodium:proton antiporter [Desulfurivibrio alkaliphilus]|uniref:Sodium:proton antiporter n=1 Tax=Desulfurivibrio alkaliphilus TaxID=427923 RepID=A0A7C2THC6_9BACT|nr:sodium:proton antiporter [Desulfurivibrio alkaliphilus]